MAAGNPSRLGMRLPKEKPTGSWGKPEVLRCAPKLGPSRESPEGIVNNDGLPSGLRFQRPEGNGNTRWPELPSMGAKGW